MGFGGSSLSYCAAPFPGPTSTTSFSSSSSSTLSPLAPPFTVDRAAPRPALPYDPYISAWPLPPGSSDDNLRHHHGRPPSPSPPPRSPPRSAHGATTTAGAAADALPYYCRPPAVPDAARAPSGEASSRGISSLAPADPYYPRFSSAAGTSVGDAPAFYGGGREGTGCGSGYLGKQAALSNSPFGLGTRAEGVGGSSAWTEREDMVVTPGYGAAFHQDAPIAPGFLAYENLQGSWHGKLTESPSEKSVFKYEHLDWSDLGSNTGVPSGLSGASALALGTSVGVCYPQSSDVHNFMEARNTSDFNSSYDRYICQGNTDQTNSKAFYPATTYFPANILGSNGNVSTSKDKCGLRNVDLVQHVSACKNGMLHGGRVSIRPKEPGIDLNFKPKEDNAGINREEDMGKIDNANVNSSVVKMTLPPNVESAKQISQGYSLGKESEIRITVYNNRGSVECDREQSSSERLDENLAEDSPCWKGAPSFRHSVSSTFDTLVADYALADQKPGGTRKRRSDYLKAENEDVALCSSGHRKDRNMVMPSEVHRDDFGSKNENIVQAVTEEKSNTTEKDDLVTGIVNLYSDLTQRDSSFCSANGQLSLSFKAMTDTSNGSNILPAISDPPFKSPTLGIDVQVLVKTIHNLSELLSSSYHFDETLLKELDKELLCSAVNNLDMCISRKPESGRMRSEVFCRSGSYPHRQLSVLSEDVPKGTCQGKGSVSIGGNLEQSNSRRTCSEQKMHSTSSNMGDDELDNISACGDKNLQKLSGKVMNEKIYEQGENPEATLYENLWSDVEDAVCLLRYRVQLLRLNALKDNCKQQLSKDAEVEATNVLKLSSQNYKNGVMGESMSPWKSTDSLPKNSSAHGKHENVNNFHKPQQMIVNNFQTPEQTISTGIDSKVDDIDGSVMARFKVLKCRIEKLNCADEEERHGQLNYLNVVNNSGMQENICSPPCLPDGRPSLGMFPTANDALPSGWGFQRPFHTGRAEGEASGSSGVQHRVADCTEALCANSHFSDHLVYEGFYAQGAGGLANQSYVRDGRSGKNFMTSVHDGSSDWEHVLEEELTW